MQELDLPKSSPSTTCLSAFLQDVDKKRYATFSEVLDYCRRSANPVGRIVLLIHGYRDEELLRYSDAICTALQLANFWQDLSVDLKKDRIYIPDEDFKAFGYSEGDLSMGVVNEKFLSLMRFELSRTRALFEQGRPLRGRLRSALVVGDPHDVVRRLRDPAQDPPHGLRYSLRAAGHEQMGLDPFGRARARRRMSAPAAPKAEKSSNFFLAFLFLSKAKREALSAVYAYCRLIDDIVDSEACRKEEARKLLDFWREEVERLYAGAPTHAVSRRLLPQVKAFALPKEAFLEMIRGCAMDLENARYETFAAELESYMRGVASSVGSLSRRTSSATSTRRPSAMARVRDDAFRLRLPADEHPPRRRRRPRELGAVYLPLRPTCAAAGCIPGRALLRREHTAPRSTA